MPFISSEKFVGKNYNKTNAENYITAAYVKSLLGLLHKIKVCGYFRYRHGSLRVIIYCLNMLHLNISPQYLFGAIASTNRKLKLGKGIFNLKNF